MAESAEGEIYWHNPDPRAVFPIDDIKPNKSTRQALKKNKFTFTVNECFLDVLNKCSYRDETWISDEIINNYYELYRMGYAHSVETWKNDELVGGLYGVAIGGAFMGESMFNTYPNASKAAFYKLIEILKQKNFILLDSQYLNQHTEFLGAIEISKERYLNLLDLAIIQNTSFDE